MLEWKYFPVYRAVQKSKAFWANWKAEIFPLSLTGFKWLITLEKIPQIPRWYFSSPHRIINCFYIIKVWQIYFYHYPWMQSVTSPDILDSHFPPYQTNIQIPFLLSKLSSTNCSHPLPFCTNSFPVEVLLNTAETVTMVSVTKIHRFPKFMIVS